MEQSQGKSDTDLQAVAGNYRNRDFTDFEALSPKEQFETCKLVIKNMVKALQGVNLRKLAAAPDAPLEVYEEVLYQMSGHFQDLHESSIGGQFERKDFSPFLDEALAHLSSALEYREKSKVFDSFQHLFAFSKALYEVKEHLEGITVQDKSQ
jgi:hypothetical protein